MIHIVFHEHLIIFQLLNGGHIRFHLAGRGFNRELHDFRGGVLGILSHLREHRIAQILADTAEGVNGGNAHPADIVGRVGIMNAAGHCGQKREGALRL